MVALHQVVRQVVHQGAQVVCLVMQHLVRVLGVQLVVCQQPAVDFLCNFHLVEVAELVHQLVAMVPPVETLLRSAAAAVVLPLEHSVGVIACQDRQLHVASFATPEPCTRKGPLAFP